MKVFKSVKKRLKNNSGESITEVLVALLISALALVLLAGMINASSNLITNSKDKISSYVEKENSIVEQGSGGDSGTVDMGIKLSDNGGSSISVKYYTNTESGKYTVKSYKVQ